MFGFADFMGIFQDLKFSASDAALASYCLSPENKDNLKLKVNDMQTVY